MRNLLSKREAVTRTQVNYGQKAEKYKCREEYGSCVADSREIFMEKVRLEVDLKRGSSLCQWTLWERNGKSTLRKHAEAKALLCRDLGPE